MHKLEANNFECFEMIFFNQITCLFLSLLKILFWNACRHLNKLKQILRKKVVWKRVIVLSWLWNILHYNLRKDIILKLYCGFRYTTLCMNNRIWVLKQLWLKDNGHAWFHLQRLRWPLRNGEGAKNPKWKYMSPGGFELTSRQSTTGKSAP